MTIAVEAGRRIRARGGVDKSYERRLIADELLRHDRTSHEALAAWVGGRAAHAYDALGRADGTITRDELMTGLDRLEYYQLRRMAEALEARDGYRYEQPALIGSVLGGVVALVAGLFSGWARLAGLAAGAAIALWSCVVGWRNARRMSAVQQGVYEAISQELGAAPAFR